MKQEIIEVSASVDADLEKVWNCWTSPEHIVNWNHANDNWHTPKAENDPVPGGKFLYRMEAKDGKMGFDFSGRYTEIRYPEVIQYALDDHRKVSIVFEKGDQGVNITERFETEKEYPVEMQREGWQAILNNFKKYVENGAERSEN